MRSQLTALGAFPCLPVAASASEPTNDGSLALAATPEKIHQPGASLP